MGYIKCLSCNLILKFNYVIRSDIQTWICRKEESEQAIKKSGEGDKLEKIPEESEDGSNLSNLSSLSGSSTEDSDCFNSMDSVQSLLSQESLMSGLSVTSDDCVVSAESEKSSLSSNEFGSEASACSQLETKLLIIQVQNLFQSKARVSSQRPNLKNLNHVAETSKTCSN